MVGSGSYQVERADGVDVAVREGLAVIWARPHSATGRLDPAVGHVSDDALRERERESVQLSQWPVKEEVGTELISQPWVVCRVDCTMNHTHETHDTHDTPHTRTHTQRERERES